MSCHIVNDRHLSALAALLCDTSGTYAPRSFDLAGMIAATPNFHDDDVHDELSGRAGLHDVSLDQCEGTITALLFRVNEASVLTRYSHHGETRAAFAPLPCGFPVGIGVQGVTSRHPLAPEVSPEQVIKSIDCFDYQCCDWPAWAPTDGADHPLRVALMRLRERCVSALVARVDTEWGWPG